MFTPVLGVIGTKVLYYILVGLLVLTSCKDNNDINVHPGLFVEDDKPVSRNYSIPIELNDSQVQLADKLNEFSWKLFDQVYKARADMAEDNGHKNVLVSPFSLLVDLSMLQNGLKGATLEHLKSLLGVKDYSVEDINEFFKVMTEGIDNADDQISFHNANSFWYNEGLTVSSVFSQKLSALYNAKLQPVDFSKPETTLLINRWCEENTNGKIKKIIEFTSPSQDFHMLNAIHYKGGWAKPFLKQNTSKAPFRNADGSVVDVDMMHNPGISTLYCEMDKYSIAQLSFRYGAFNFFMILPKEGYNVSDIIASITPDELRRGEKAIVDLTLPKFEIEYGTNKVMDCLRSIDKDFDFNPSDTNMFIDHDASISIIIQKAYLSIDEDGAEAAAITDITSHTHSDKPKYAEMHLDRPFIYGILETSTNMPLFIGYYGN